MPAPIWFEYAAIRVVPRVEREEFVNVGVVLFAPTARFLAIRLAPRWEALRALAPDLDLDLVRRHLDGWRAVAEGREDGGPIAALPPSERFHWLTAPRSTLVQPSPVHSGQCEDLEAAIEALLAEVAG